MEQRNFIVFPRFVTAAILVIMGLGPFFIAIDAVRHV